MNPDKLAEVLELQPTLTVEEGGVVEDFLTSFMFPCIMRG